MKKRLLSWLMVLTLCLTLLPTAALADTGAGESSGSEKHEHYLCGTNHTCSSTWDNTKHTFTAWTDELAAKQWNSDKKTASNSLPRWSSESYYLTKNVELEAEDSYSPWSGGGITLCLNGHSIRMKGNKSVISVSSGTFTLVDCKGDSESGEYGQITHASGSGHGVELTGGTFTMYGGNITGNTAGSGGGVYMTGRSTFNLYGGQITSNTATGSGGGVYSEYGTNHNSTFNMYGGQIADNNGNIGGGGVFYGNGTFTMRGGEISGNSGGGGSSKNGGGGVCIVGAMTVSGDVEITGNTEVTDSVSTNNNVYLRGSDAVITIDGALTGGAGSIGVSKSTRNLTAGKSVKIAEGKNYTLTDDDLKAFSSDAGDPYQIQKSGNELLLVNTTNVPHKHCICGKTHAAIGDHTSESATTFATKLWYDEDNKKLMMGTDEWKSTNVELYENYYVDYYVLEAGSYYLGSDISPEHAIRISGDVNLCLNGCKITSSGNSLGSVIVDTGSFTLTDCKNSGSIEHADRKSGSGVYMYGNNTTFNMYGGTITKNSGSGVYVTQYNTFNMYGGSITDNNNSHGGGVYNGGTVNMYGGEISGNTATTYGGGVYVDSYSTVFKVSGAAKITGNMVNGAANNVYLPSGKTFTLGSHFTKDTYIGVTTADEPTPSSNVIIAKNVGELTYTNIIKSDSNKYETKQIEGSLVLAAKNGTPTPAKHEHYLCGGSKSCTCPTGHKENGVTEFQPWTSTTSLPNTAGNYYLTGPVTLVDSYWKPADGTVLCLNGYSITVNKNTEPKGSYVGAIVVESKCTFTLADCKGGKTEYGQITHGTNTETNSKYTGGGVCVYGTFNMYGGNITGNELTQEWYCGGGVSVHAAAGIFNLYGGSITDNKSNNTSTASPCGEGGGVYTIGKFTMYGGTISGNEAHRSGGGVYAAGDFTMEGGTISNNTANGKYYTGYATYSGGGGVFVAGKATFTMKNGTISDNTVYGPGGGVYVAEDQGSFVMENGTISGNEALTNNESYNSGEGGGVFVHGRECSFTMQNGSITGNSAVNGGGVYVDGRFTMTGGEISGNNCDSGEYFYGGGVCVASSRDTVLTVSGDVEITDNTQGSGSDSTASNVYLPSGKTITIGGALTGEAGSIGVTTSTEPREKRPVTIANNVTTDHSGKFTSDKEGFKVECKDDKLVLVKKSDKQEWPAFQFTKNSETKTYGDDPFALTASSSASGSTVTYSSSNTRVAEVDNNGNVTINGAGTITITATAAETNTYAKTTATCTLTVNKRQITVPAADSTEFTYNGKEQTYKLAEDNAYTISGNKQTDAKEEGYTVTVSLNDRANTKWASDGDDTADKAYTFIIKKATVTVTAKDQSISVGGTAPDLTAPVKDTHYTVTGLVGSDALNGTLTMKYQKDGSEKTPDTTKEGTYNIVVSGVSAPNDSNYNEIILTKGTLTVKAASTPSTPSTPSSGSSSGSSTIKTETTTNPDGSVTRTETRSDGTVIETTTNPDGSTSKTESKTTTKSNGSTVETVTETNTGADGSKSTSKTETTTAKDGSKTETKSETKTEADGTKSETKSETKTDANGVTSGTETTKTIAPNGSTGTTTTTTENGNTKTEAEAKVSEKAIEDAKKSGEAVKVPTEVKAGENSNSAPTVKVELPKNAGETKIKIPVSDVNSGTVAVIVHPDGTEEIVKDSKPTADGVELTVNGSATVKVIDNSKDFIDTRNHWSRDEVNFVASREIFNGVGGNLFGVGQPMTRGMVNTVLARLAGIDTTPENGQKWYEVGTEWAKANGITDGTNPEASVTREQLATLLYRFCGTPEVSGVLSFADAGEVSDYAQSALLWATQNDILNGVGNNRVAPNADAQRAQVAAMMARYLKNVG